MKITNLQIINSVSVLNRLLDERLPMITRHIVSGNVKLLEPILKNFNETRELILKQTEINNNMKELLELDNEVNITQIKITDFGNFELTNNEYDFIKWMIEE